MSRCPHCGEPVKPGQERCFACGEKLRVKKLYKNRLIDYRIFILAGALVIIGLAGIIIVRGGKNTKTQPGKRKTAARPISKDTTRKERLPETIAVGNIALERAREQLERLRRRYETVKNQVLGETPTSEQREMMRQIDRAISNFQRLTMELSGTLTEERKEQLEREIAAHQREINNLISKFSRLPKNR